MVSDFFGERSLQSTVKAELVKNYFKSWAGIMKGSASKYNKDTRLAFFDLFCGPGRYEDGTQSVPLEVISLALTDPYLRENLVTFFNDVNKEIIGSLREEINNLDGIENLNFPPEISCAEIDENFRSQVESQSLIPSFSFIDPWGYKGLSIGLIEAFIKDWGCDCFFFFNYNRINMGMTNQPIAKHINSLFGQSGADAIREKISNDNLTSNQRNSLVLEGIISALEQKAGNEKRFVLPFCFKGNNNSRISHYLIFVTKHFRGYAIMKDIMYKASTTRDQGVASFDYCPADENAPRLFEMTRPLEDLKSRLLDNRKNSKITLERLYATDSYRTPFIKKNYKDMCLQLEKENLIKITRPKLRSPKNTVADKSIIHF